MGLLVINVFPSLRFCFSWSFLKLSGSNGSGKSTFLTSLASRELPIPDHIDIFHLDEEAEPSDRTALEAVIDVVREKVSNLISWSRHGPFRAHLVSIKQVEKLEQLSEHILETAGPDAEILQVLLSNSHPM